MTLYKTLGRVRATALVAALGLLMAAAIVVVPPPPAAYAHGGLTYPATRTYACYVDGIQNGQGGDVNPQNPMCRNALAVNGNYPFYNWFGNLLSDDARARPDHHGLVQRLGQAPRHVVAVHHQGRLGPVAAARLGRPRDGAVRRGHEPAPALRRSPGRRVLLGRHAAEQVRIPHHLLDLDPVGQP